MQSRQHSILHTGESKCFLIPLSVSPSLMHAAPLSSDQLPVPSLPISQSGDTTADKETPTEMEALIVTQQGMLNAATLHKHVLYSALSVVGVCVHVPQYCVRCTNLCVL